MYPCDFSFTTNNQKGTVKLFRDLKDRKTYIKIPKLKTPIHIVMHRAPIAGSVIKSATISMDILGNYDISILLEYDDAPVMPFIMSTSKTCSDCGAMHEHLELSDRIFSCPEGGLVIGRDHNAAINIRQQGIVMLLSID